MSAVKNFRSAFNGFNREDVVHYIEYVNNKHNATINQLNNELQSAKSELAALQAKPDQDPELLAQLEETLAANAALNEEMNTLRSQINDLTQEAAEARAAQEVTAQKLEQADNDQSELDALRRELEATKLELERSRQAAATVQVNYELEAYRRAERAERMAGERVNRMYEQMNGILADAASQAEENANQIGQAAERVAEQLSELQTALANSSSAMKCAADAMYAIRPLKEEE